MNDNTDIVEYLRRNAVFNYKDTYMAAADEIERLRKQRDEARREVCLLKSYNYENTITPKAYAELRKWDCFATLQVDNPALDRLAELDDEIESRR